MFANKLAPVHNVSKEKKLKKRKKSFANKLAPVHNVSKENSVKEVN
jgi:hypothetical protein